MFQAVISHYSGFQDISFYWYMHKIGSYQTRLLSWVVNL